MNRGISGGADLGHLPKSNLSKYLFIFFILLLIAFMSGHLFGYRIAQKNIQDECNKFIEENYGTNKTNGITGSVFDTNYSFNIFSESNSSLHE